MGAGGYWEQTPQGAPQLTRPITIDPAKNGGARAEVAVKGVTGGTVMLTPGARAAARIATSRSATPWAAARAAFTPTPFSPIRPPTARWAWAKAATSPSSTMPSIGSRWTPTATCSNAPRRTGARASSIHAKEQRILSTGVYKNSVEHKYSYNAVQYKIPAYGWSSTKEHIGVWFINPTIEYLSGGASKQELVCHFDANDNPDPIILDYWRGTHYGGGASCNIAAGEKWSKVIGPIFVYCNALADPKIPSQADLDTLAATAGNPTVPPAWKDNATAAVAGCARPGQEGEGPVALRLGQRRRLPAQGRARQRHRPTRAQRPAGGHDQAAPSDRRPGPPGLHRQRRRVRAAVGQRQSD